MEGIVPLSFHCWFLMAEEKRKNFSFTVIFLHWVAFCISIYFRDCVMILEASLQVGHLLSQQSLKEPKGAAILSC